MTEVGTGPTAVDRDDRVAIDDLALRYIEVLDDGPLEAWPDLFTEHGSYRIVGRSNVERGLSLAAMRCDSRAMMGDRVHALRRANFYLPRQTRHLVGPARIRVTGIDRWTARSNYAVFETIAGESTTTLNVGVYDDVVIRDQDGEMRFERRWCVYDSELVPNSIVFPI